MNHSDIQLDKNLERQVVFVASLGLQDKRSPGDHMPLALLPPRRL
jgi:hypothetical protein